MLSSDNEVEVMEIANTIMRKCLVDNRYCRSQLLILVNNWLFTLRHFHYSRVISIKYCSCYYMSDLSISTIAISPPPPKIVIPAHPTLDAGTQLECFVSYAYSPNEFCVQLVRRSYCYHVTGSTSLASFSTGWPNDGTARICNLSTPLGYCVTRDTLFSSVLTWSIVVPCDDHWWVCYHGEWYI